MNTDDLIRAIAADEIRPKPVETLLPLVLLVTAILVGGLFYSTFGVRSGWTTLIREPAVFFKQVSPGLLAIAAFGAVLRLARPGRRLDGWGAGLLLAPAIALAAFWTSALSSPVASWASAIAGQTLWACLFFITLIGLPILVGSLWALRRGASTSPTLTGGLAGLLSGGISATIYAAYCPEDSPMFWGVWYVLAIGIVASIGAGLGRWSLRW